MGTVIQYQPEQWKAMANIKSSMFMMKGNPEYRDDVKERVKKSFQYFLKEVPHRSEG